MEIAKREIHDLRETIEETVITKREQAYVIRGG
jgi:hypothetical protein